MQSSKVHGLADRGFLSLSSLAETHLEDAVGNQTDEAHDAAGKGGDVIICACKGWHLHRNSRQLRRAGQTWRLTCSFTLCYKSQRNTL